MADVSRTIPRISKGNDYLFRLLWRLQYPVLVHSVGDNLQGRWSPEAFIVSHGSENVLMIDSRRGTTRTKSTKAAQFFSEFMRTDIHRGADWPPSTSFTDKFKHHYEAFNQAVPMQSYTRNDELRNLAAHFPISPSSVSNLKPDLGPKMYLATRDINKAGSTCLHLDATSAVNILVYTSDEDSPGALWHIFRAEDTDVLRRYLRSLPVGKAFDDPIHARSIYLTPQMLSELEVQGVRPFAVQQRFGEAIFIPAGCAHQVSNTSACIKVACDFLCVEGIVHSMKMAEEFRKIHHEDVLGMDLLLWHAWISLREQKERFVESGVITVQKTRKQRKRFAQRHTMRGQDDQARRNQARQSRLSRDDSQLPAMRCPDLACASSKRTFRVLDGVFNHL
ncbi:hypothetical protein C8Q78DRAFT_981528 [Trametes maxima]|nr:hypothetical protein C8Q78DRAFT_981528 [Trametes maxima]